MPINNSNIYFNSIVNDLLKYPNETEFLEFKGNNQKPEEIGEYISALANSAALIGQVSGYIIWGVSDDTHKIVGTTFQPSQSKVGNEELENWLLRLLNPKINIKFHELCMDNNLPVVLLEISAAFNHPVRFMDQAYIRVGSYKKKLKEFPEKERELWRFFDRSTFEKEIAVENLNASEVLQLLDYTVYFDLLKIPQPESRDSILETLKAEAMLTEALPGKWNITNLGAILFAKKLSQFSHLKRKAVRVILYSEDSRYETIREVENDRGYAAGYDEIIKNILIQVPSKEVIGQAFRREIMMFPEIAIRELVANAMMHQDFYQRGTSVMVEIFAHRIEITNPGPPLIKVDRFLDSPPQSRNDALTSFMRRIGISEERGTGIDKVVIETETHHLPPPLFEVFEHHTRATLFAQKAFKDLMKTDRLRACYLHASLKYLNKDFMTNTSLRERFQIDPKNSAMVSRVIAEAIEANLIRRADHAEEESKARKYLPAWA